MLVYKPEVTNWLKNSVYVPVDMALQWKPIKMYDFVLIIIKGFYKIGGNFSENAIFRKLH